MSRKAAGVASKRAGRSLHIGLNAVAPAHYAGWSGPLAACEFDANDMADVARSRGITPKVLLTKAATRARVLAGIRAAASRLKKGDLFFLTYSGHGGQVPDVTGEEAEGRDETWCLFDGELIDDELYFALSRFAPGVRILVLSDSCHSGTVTRAPVSAGADVLPRSRMMPPAVADATYRKHQRFYDDLQRRIAQAAGTARSSVDPDSVLSQLVVKPRLERIVKKFRPASILISGCQDNQTSMDGDRNGAFTGALLEVWSEGAFPGDYRRFHATIRNRLPASQSPNLFTLGAAGTFLRQRPLTV
jgi:metacaspase-1